jgi:exodeoxyribonuclease VII large subunit
MFRSANRKLKFEPEGGMKVVARGYVSIYNRSGLYQLYVKDLQPEGVGSLHLAFKQLKKKLRAEGLFAEEHKKSLPTLPSCVGVVTSASGAALRDIINVGQRRFPQLEFIVIPTRVQGEGAAEDIAAAIRRANRCGRIDVLIVGRGGGSLEDLWAFNEEPVARAVFDSRLPVVAAVGHETDFTMAGFTADVRAPTPSAAAELVVPDQKVLAEQLRNLQSRLQNALVAEAREYREKLKQLTSKRIFARPFEIIRQQGQFVDELHSSLLRAAQQQLQQCQSRWRLAAEKLNALSPLGVLARGYAVCQDDEGRIIKNADDVQVGDRVSVWLSEGFLGCEIERKDEERVLSSADGAADLEGVQ